MVKSMFARMMWIGKGTVFVVGLSVILALLFGAASTAFAHGGYKGLFHLGHNNASKTVSTLIKQGPGPALRLLVRSGQPPMAVNSQVKVSNLNADRLDGRDSAGFMPSKIYAVEASTTTPANTLSSAVASCDAGDLAISGGFESVDPTSHVLTSSLSS
jgi:hypothetical protein